MHAEHLEAVHGVGPHTISVPRVKHADDIDPEAFDNSLDDEIFEKIAACIRIAVPYTGMIISTRESQEVRGKMLHLGVSQISGASRTSVGGYTEEDRPHDSEQFDVSDQRTLDEVKVTSNLEKEIKENIKTLDITKSVEIEESGKIINVIALVNDDIEVNKSKEIGNKVIEKLSDKQKKYFDVQIFIKKSSKDEKFPIIGYKHHNKDNITWTKDR